MWFSKGGARTRTKTTGGAELRFTAQIAHFTTLQPSLDCQVQFDRRSYCFWHRRRNVTVSHRWAEDVFWLDKQWTSSGQKTGQCTSCDSVAENRCCLVACVNYQWPRDIFRDVIHQAYRKHANSFPSMKYNCIRSCFRRCNMLCAKAGKSMGYLPARPCGPWRCRRERRLSRRFDTISERCRR